MSAATTVARLIEVLDRETGAVLAGAPDASAAAIKDALARELAGLAGPGVPEADAARLRDAAVRNRAALGVARDAGIALLRDLSARLAAVESDGTYRRSELCEGVEANAPVASSIAPRGPLPLSPSPLLPPPA